MRSSAWLAGAFLVPLTLSAVEDITGQTPVNTGARQIAVIVKDDRQAVYRIPEQPKEPEKPKEENQTEKPAEKSVEKPIYKVPETAPPVGLRAQGVAQMRADRPVQTLPSTSKAKSR